MLILYQITGYRRRRRFADGGGFGASVRPGVAARREARRGVMAVTSPRPPSAYFAAIASIQKRPGDDDNA